MFSFSKCLALIVGVVAGVNAAGPLQQQTGSWGDNPTNVGFYYYKPTSVSPNPALIVAIHYCGGTAQAFYSGTSYANLADQHGFIVIYPDAPDAGGCWDVHTSATLTHDGGGDSLGIANMVRFAISIWGVDASRVYMTGLSSGAMMTNVLAGAYPDLFAAGSAWAGVPYGCFSGPDMWNSACSTGQITKSGQEWGDEVRSGYPGYTGPRPKLQIWQGTLDTTLNYHNFGEGIKQWTNIFGYSETPTEVDMNWPLPNWTRSIYGHNFQAISAAGVDHNIQIQANQVLEWFGITGDGSTPTSAPPTTPTTTTTSPPTTTSPSGPVQSQWGQCGGTGWPGPFTCVAGTTCQVINQWYSQCLWIHA